MTKPTLTVPEAADTLGVHPNTVFKLIESGALPAAKIGRAYIMLTVDVMTYIERQVMQQTAQRMGGQPVKRKRSPELAGQH
jgi:excisionase family DNA binding protein